MLKSGGSRKGFTLIELLVVVAIIIILAMILMGAFMKAQDKAKEAMCIAHGRQLGMAMLMYVDDYDGVFPGHFVSPIDGSLSAVPYPWNDPTEYFYNHPINGTPNPEYASTQFKNIDGTPQSWGKPAYPNWPAFNEYIKNKDVWICPNARWYYGERYGKGMQISWICRTGDWGPGNGGSTGDDPGWGGRTLKQIEMVMYTPRYKTVNVSSTDTAYGFGWDRRRTSIDRKIMFHCYATRTYNNGADPLLGLPYCSHGDGSVYVYMDGHAGYAMLPYNGFFPENYPYNQ
jgi:prepilin-type N-terminal cleavage/methylation domain-containing protein